MRPDPTLPSDLRELAYGEHLIVWTFRAIATGRWSCPMIRREYDHACGARGGEAMAAIRVFADKAAAQGRRPVSIGRPGMLPMTRDEQLLVALYADAQRGDEAGFLARASWLLARPADEALYRLAWMTATALEDGGHGLGAPLPHAEAEARRACA